MIRKLAFVAMATGVPHANLGAQSGRVFSSGLPAGVRVRVDAPALSREAIVGRLAGVDSLRLSLTITPAGTTLAIPLRHVSAVQASRGIDRRLGAKRGAVVGLVAGAAFFASTYHELRVTDTFGIGRVFLFLVSFGIAPATGALVGTAIAPETWEPLTMPAARGATVLGPAIHFAHGEDVRVRIRGHRYKGRATSQTQTTLTVATPDATVPISWRDITGVQVRGGRNRRAGAAIGALTFIGLGILGEQTAPTTSTGERVGAFTGAAIVGGYLGSRFLAPRGWISLPLGSGTAAARQP